MWRAVKASWTPSMDYGTWHPLIEGRLHPVMYIHQLRGQPTGLFFSVSRPRYWWICGLVKLRRAPFIGKLARTQLARMRVAYCWSWRAQACLRA